MNQAVKDFNDYRERMNKKILDADNLVLKRIFNIDANAYKDGALTSKTKEMIGLAASLVLRCDDCVKYHLGKCHELGIKREELFEVLAVCNLVGGTIVIPHTRRAVEYWDALDDN
jgi:AhpD family alkylhydroperoxidase